MSDYPAAGLSSFVVEPPVSVFVFVFSLWINVQCPRRPPDYASTVYAGPMATKTIDDIQPKAVTSPTEQGRRGSLPPDEQLARLRAVIQRGVDRPSSVRGATECGFRNCWQRLD